MEKNQEKNYNKIPEFLIEELEKQYGEEVTKKILLGYEAKRKVTFRVNTLKTTCDYLEHVLKKNKIDFEKVKFIENAYIIKNVTEKEIRLLDIYSEGKIYLQSLSSMLPAIILNPKENKDILDMAAAPGGKTTQLASLTKNNSHITACEVSPIRAERLKYNIEKQGATSVYVMITDSRKIDEFFSFDQILLDSPCSGSGTLNINDKNINKMTKKLILKSNKSQEELIKKAMKILKKGGELVYSTCSILRSENEDIINKILKDKSFEISKIKLPSEIPTLESKIDGTICVMPTELFEGFFIAKIIKK